MFLAILMCLAFTGGGLGVTYLIESRSTLIARVAAGAVIGMSIFGLVGFVFALVIGFTGVSVVLAGLVSGLPMIIFRNKASIARLRADISDSRDLLASTFTHFDLTRVVLIISYAG